MIVFHVCGISLLDRYRKAGKIRGPVRAWKNLSAATKFSCQTGRPIILRLKFPETATPLEGHHGNAVYIDTDYRVDQILGKFKY